MQSQNGWQRLLQIDSGVVRMGPYEDPNPSKLTRTHTKYACGNCHRYGHNTRKCPSRPINEDVATQTPNVADGASNQANEIPNVVDNNGTTSSNPPNEVVNAAANNGGAPSNPPNKPLNVATAKGNSKRGRPAQPTAKPQGQDAVNTKSGQPSNVAAQERKA
ncbi:Zinc finger, CCHC-type superfamily [Sesbania bispinosa]|nr:Zinc finger, CCHC-type superfamily [Sesbania bispinosa]